MLGIILAIENPQDRTFVGDLYGKYAKKLLYIANEYLHNKQDSEDCVQEVFETVINMLEKFKGYSEAHQANLLVTVTRCSAVNKFKSKMRKKTKETSITELEDEDIAWESYSAESSAQDVVISEESVRRIKDMIEDMDEKYRDIMYLRYFCELGNTEIAKIVGIPAEHVNVRIMRAKKWLFSKKGDELNELRRK